MRVFFFCLMWGICLCAQAEQPLRIAVASNFKPTLEALLPLWASHSDGPVKISSASSGTLSQQILYGAPFDLFFAADSDYPARLNAEGVAQAPQTYALGTLALVCRFDADTAAAAMEQSQRLALANVRTAPYGRAADQWLQSHHPTMAAQRVQAGSVAGALQFVATGNSDCALVASSFKRLSPSLHWYSLQGAPTLKQDAVILTESALARQFLQFVLDQPAQRLIQSHGYESAAE